MYIHKHTVFWVFCLFVPSCLLLVVWNKSGVVGVTNLYQFLWLFFFSSIKERSINKNPVWNMSKNKKIQTKFHLLEKSTIG